MYSTLHHASPRSRLAVARHVSPTQQRRQLSFNPWSSRGSESRREARHRHRLLAYRYMDSINRHMAWDNDARTEGPRAAMKKVMAEWIHSSNHQPPSGKYTNMNDVKSWSDDLSGMRPGRNIEDVERDAINHLFHKSDTMWSPLQNIRNYLHASRSSGQVTPEDVLKATTSTNFIDPITNRRVSRAEHDKYSATKFDDPNAPRKLTPEEESKFYNDLGEYKPATWNEPDGLPELTPEEESKKYKDLHKYSATKIDNPNAPRKLAPEEESKSYTDLDKYQPVTWNEPDGLQKPTPEELSKNYDDLDKYGPVRWNEPDGLQEQTPEERSKNYEDLDKYGPVTWNEPDGLRLLTPEEKSKNYDDLDSYSGPFVAKDSVLEAHAALQNDATPKGEPLPAKVHVRAEATATQYDDLDKYGPVHWNEPDGLPPLTPEERSKEYEDLHKYEQYDNAGPKTPRVHPEEASKQYEDLPGYSAFPNAGPETQRIHPEEASKNYKDLHGYPVHGYVEPEKTRHVHPEELTKNYPDLDKYESQSFDSPEQTYPIHPEEASKTYKDLRHYKTAPPDAVPNESTIEMPDPVAAGLKSYDSKVKMQADMAASAAKHRGVQSITDLYESRGDSVESMTADDIRAQVMLRAGVEQANAGRNAESEEVEMSSMDESFPSEEPKHTSASTEEILDKLAQMRAEKDPYSTDPKGLEISYSEECAGETGPGVAKHYEACTSGELGSEEPVCYKILAYDPATQSISVAETTSKDHDPPSPPTLTEVLLRLSHPSKFLPHFQSLQAQGYDIVSGGGDVLIFRKNRPAAANAGDFTTTTTIHTARINPVDMMGRPVTGNFASPTGFVNYDALEEGHGKPAPPFRSSESTPREEPARSEQGLDAERKEKKKGSLGEYVPTGGK